MINPKIIDEAELEILRTWRKGETDIGGVGFPEGLAKRFPDIDYTIAELWRVVHCARNWLRAPQGSESTEAEAIMQEQVDALFSKIKLSVGYPSSKRARLDRSRDPGV